MKNDMYQNFIHSFGNNLSREITAQLFLKKQEMYMKQQREKEKQQMMNELKHYIDLQIQNTIHIQLENNVMNELKQLDKEIKCIFK